MLQARDLKSPLGRLAQRLFTNRPEAQVTNACKTPLFLLVLLKKRLTKTVNHFEIYPKTGKG